MDEEHSLPPMDELEKDFATIYSALFAKKGHTFNWEWYLPKLLLAPANDAFFRIKKYVLATPVVPDDTDTLVVELKKNLSRAAYLVNHLAEQVPEFTGVLGPQGEKEDDYIRYSLHEEAQTWEALAGKYNRTGEGETNAH